MAAGFQRAPAVRPTAPYPDPADGSSPMRAPPCGTVYGGNGVPSQPLPSRAVASAVAGACSSGEIRARVPGMSDHVYKKIQLVGTSSKSIEEAVNTALVRANKTIRNMRWFEVSETRGTIENGQVGQWQVTVQVGFTLDE